jgi:hypothetical protein
MNLERTVPQRRFAVIAVLEIGWLAFLVWLAVTAASAGPS